MVLILIKAVCVTMVSIYVTFVFARCGTLHCQQNEKDANAIPSHKSVLTYPAEFFVAQHEIPVQVSVAIKALPCI